MSTAESRRPRRAFRRTLFAFLVMTTTFVGLEAHAGSGAAVRGADPAAAATRSDAGTELVGIDLETTTAGDTVTVAVDVIAASATTFTVVPTAGITTSAMPTTLDPDGGVDSTVSLTVSPEAVGQVQFAAMDSASHTGVETLYVHEHAGTVYTNDHSATEIERAVLDARLDAGELTEEQHQDAVGELVGGGALEERGAAAALSCSGVCISGSIRWTDVAGGVHPVRRAPVEIRDAETWPLSDDVVTTVTTDEDGNYSAAVDNDDGLLQGGRDIYIRAKAEGPGFTSDKHIDSSTTDDVSTGTSLTLSLTARNDDEDHRAFSIQAGLVWGLDYVEQVRGSRFEEFEVQFPTDGSYYSGGALHIDDDDPFDWDVILHEYGHYIQDQMDITDSPGGPHYWNSNLAEDNQPEGHPPYGKDDGTRMAWGEGWPTYFAVSGLQRIGASASGVPHVGNDSYDDRRLDDSANIVESLEPVSGKAGEDNEVTTAEIMYDLFDGASGAESKDHAQFSDRSLWATLDAADPGSLSAAYDALKSLGDNDVNCVFSLNGVAPDMAGAEREIVAKDSPPPTITWTPGGGGPAFRSNSFTVRFTDAGGSRTLLETPAQTTTSFTPTAAQWEDITNRSAGIVDVTVTGRQTDSPETGPYTSCRKRFVSRSVDLAIVVDTTGSMWDDIDAVKAAATDITSTLLQGDVDAHIAVVDYKDDGDAYQARVDVGLTADAGAVVGAIDSLYADGGGDTPESVYSGVMTALGLGFRTDVDKKAVIVMGDAPAKDPEPVTGYTLAAVLSAAADGGIDVSSAPDGPARAAPAAGTAATAAHGAPVSIYSVVIGGDPSALASLGALALGSGGSTFEVSSASGVVGAILDSIDEIFKRPVALPGGPYSGYVGSAVNFDGSASFDPDGTLVDFEWDFDADGTFDAGGSTPTATHTYAAPYSGNVVLRVTDESGQTATGRAAVEVVPAPVSTARARIIAVRDAIRSAPATSWRGAALSALRIASAPRLWVDDDHLRPLLGHMTFSGIEMADATLAKGRAGARPWRVELATAAQRIAGLQIDAARPSFGPKKLALARAAKARGDMLLAWGNTRAALVAFHTAWALAS
ncbi:MAG: PKD domain-containing protein [Acidimicrobiia bacterium]